MKNTPWSYVDGNVVDWTGAVVSVSGIAQPHGFVPPEDESHSHGRLLAAAPSMLKALKRADKALEKVYGETGTLDPTNAVYRDMQAVKDAIRRAEGRS